MRALAESHDAAAIGCTQVSEILYTSGVELVGVLPREFGLTTTYSAAICRDADLAGDDAAAIRFLRSALVPRPGEAALLHALGGLLEVQQPLLGLLGQQHIGSSVLAVPTCKRWSMMEGISTSVGQSWPPPEDDSG